MLLDPVDAGEACDEAIGGAVGGCGPWVVLLAALALVIGAGLFAIGVILTARGAG
jgi:hypothetical protein